AMVTRVTSPRAGTARHDTASAVSTPMRRSTASYYMWRHEPVTLEPHRRVADWSAAAVRAAGLPGARLSHACPPVDGRREARGRRLLVAGRQAPRVPERARARQSLLSNLCRRSDDRRHEADFARLRQDDVRVLPARDGRDRIRVHARRSEIEAAAGGRARDSRVGQGAPLLVGLRPRDGHLLL